MHHGEEGVSAPRQGTAGVRALQLRDKQSLVSSAVWCFERGTFLYWIVLFVILAMNFFVVFVSVF